MRNKLIIIGANGHGKVAADIAMKTKKWKNILFLDDDSSIKRSMGLEVIGKIEDALLYKKKTDFFVAIGNNTTREIIQKGIEDEGLSVVSLIHPNAVLGKDVTIGKGTAIMAGVVINSCTRVGKGCIINTNSSLDHDNIIEDYVHISPGSNLAGTVKICKRTWIGIGSVISNNINVCNDCIVGAGAVIIKNISETGTYVGMPARRIDK